MRTGSHYGSQSGQVNRQQNEYGQNHHCGGDSPGKLAVVGIGPGSSILLTEQARNRINAADVVMGYESYIELVHDLLADKKVLSYGMTEEVERAKAAIAEARQGQDVVMVSGGDPGIYGMAGLLLEMAAGSGIMVEVIPGVTAATAAASRLGAPLMHDFAVISLSDRLTPWEVIRKRIEAAALADFVIVIYNPRSLGRVTQLTEAQQLIAKFRSPQTPVGIVKRAYRGGEQVIVSDVGSFLTLEIDMGSTVIIGNSQTKIVDGRMVTPRGYSV